MRNAKMEDATMRLLPIAGMVIAYCITANAMATDYKAGSLAISGPWSRATPKGAQAGVGYLAIKNNGTTPDRLIGGSVAVADHFELHVTIIENGIARMRERSEIEIKPGETIEFKPGGSHAMFVDLRHPLSKGEHIKGTLIFEHAGTVQIEYSVEGIGAQMNPGEMKQMQH
jgi:periplasmic copper chaperone A